MKAGLATGYAHVRVEVDDVVVLDAVALRESVQLIPHGLGNRGPPMYQDGSCSAGRVSSSLRTTGLDRRHCSGATTWRQTGA
jgi:hypothetical protein